MELIPITFNKIMQSRSYTIIILGTAQKSFAIYTDPHVGKNIQTYLTEEETVGTTKTISTQYDRSWFLWLKAARNNPMFQ